MLKVIVFLLIAGIAGVMGFMAWRGECASGYVFATVDECAAQGSFRPEACREMFTMAAETVGHAATVFPTEQACRDQFEVCIPHKMVSGFTPVPAAYCVSRVRSRMMPPEPIYRRINTTPVRSGTS